MFVVGPSVILLVFFLCVFWLQNFRDFVCSLFPKAILFHFTRIQISHKGHLLKTNICLYFFICANSFVIMFSSSFLLVPQKGCAS